MVQCSEVVGAFVVAVVVGVGVVDVVVVVMWCI